MQAILHFLILSPWTVYSCNSRLKWPTFLIPALTSHSVRKDRPIIEDYSKLNDFLFAHFVLGDLHALTDPWSLLFASLWFTTVVHVILLSISWLRIDTGPRVHIRLPTLTSPVEQYTVTDVSVISWLCVPYEHSLLSGDMYCA